LFGSDELKIQGLQPQKQNSDSKPRHYNIAKDEMMKIGKRMKDKTE
jgi:hypothetical protein